MMTPLNMSVYSSFPKPVFVGKAFVDVIKLKIVTPTHNDSMENKARNDEKLKKTTKDSSFEI